MFPFAGYGLTWTYDTAIALIAAMMDEEELFVNKAERSLSVKYGRPQIDPVGYFGNFVKKMSQAGTQALWDAIDD